MGLPSYVINWDELSDLITNYLKSGIKVDIGDLIFDTNGIERLLENIQDKMEGVNYNDLINALNSLGVKLDALSGNLGLSGVQRIYGKILKIPAIKGEHIIEFKAPRSGSVTGITYSQSAWRFEDNWNLTINNNEVFNGVRTKEYGEHKYFNVFYPIKAGQIIKFIFNNESATNKVLWVDFNILENKNSTNIVNTSHRDTNASRKDYRLLAIGEGVYTLEGAKNLDGCVNDAVNISKLFKDHKQEFKKNVVGKNKTKIEVLKLIKDTFRDAKDGDINYLFWSGHGTVVEDKYALIAKDNIITVDELEGILDDIKGTKIIMIDTCHSGKAINKEFRNELNVFGKFLENKNLDIDIDRAVNKKAMRMINKGIKAFNKELNKSDYKIITSCSGTEKSKDLSSGYYGNPLPSGAFTWALTSSIVNKKADKDNNKVVTLQELYETILHFWDQFNTEHPQAQITQKTQVYPSNDETIVFEYTD